MTEDRKKIETAETAETASETSSRHWALALHSPTTFRVVDDYPMGPRERGPAEFSVHRGRHHRQALQRVTTTRRHGRSKPRRTSQGLAAAWVLDRDGRSHGIVLGGGGVTNMVAVYPSRMSTCECVFAREGRPFQHLVEMLATVSETPHRCPVCSSETHRDGRCMVVAMREAGGAS